MIFDSWGGVLADGAFSSSAWNTRGCWRSSSAPAWTAGRAAHRLHQGRRHLAEDMKDIDCEVLGLDWTANLGQARHRGRQVGGWPRQALQGNIDPNVLFARRRPWRAGAPRAGQLWQAAHRPHHHRPHAHLQPGPRHQPVPPARACGGPGEAVHSYSRAAASVGLNHLVVRCAVQASLISLRWVMGPTKPHAAPARNRTK